MLARNAACTRKFAWSKLVFNIIMLSTHVFNTIMFNIPVLNIGMLNTLLFNIGMFNIGLLNTGGAEPSSVVGIRIFRNKMPTHRDIMQKPGFVHPERGLHSEMLFSTYVFNKLCLTHLC